MKGVIKMKAIIFDFDGTLVDTMPIWRSLGTKYLKQLGKEPQAGLREQLSRMTMNESIQFLIDEYGLSKTNQEVAVELNEILKQKFRDLELRKHFQDVLNFFKSKEVTMCIASANEREHIEAFLDANKLHDYFEFVLTCSETNTTKNDAKIYDLSVEKLSLHKDEVIVVEDALHAIKTLKTNHYYVVGIYESNEINNIDQIKYLCDEYYYSAEEWLRKLNN